MAQWVGALSHSPGGCGFDPQSESPQEGLIRHISQEYTGAFVQV